VQFRHILIALVVPLTWGFGFAFAKAGLGYFPPLLLMGLRFLLAALVLAWFVPVPRGHFLSLFIIAFIAATLQYGLTFSGLARMAATPAVLLVQSEVIFGVVIAAIVLREIPSFRQGFGMVAAGGGVMVILGAPALDGQAIGAALVLGGALVWAFGQVLIRRLDGALSGFQLTAWLGVMAGPQMLLASVLIDGNPLPVMQAAPPAAWFTVLYLGLVMTVIGYSAWYYLLARYPVPVVMPVLLLLPVATICGAVTMLGEIPDPTVLVGGALVIAGVGVVIVDPAQIRGVLHKKPARPNQ
jgi:O-acetylserine/cysteine efflux transporter